MKMKSAETFSRKMKHLLNRILFPIALFGSLAYFFPKTFVFYLICGIYDVSRNTALNREVVRRYFLGNGVLTWLLSPFNVLMDIFALPYINKGVYRLDDFPSAYQDELKSLIALTKEVNLVDQIAERAKEFPRTMIFFKWYGANVDTFLQIPSFQRPWKFIQTIGVSVFNKKVSTSRHFGPTRTTLRVLYNLNDIDDKSAYIVVGNVTNYWRDNKLFIFDDTLLHQSINGTEKVRYCLFVDIIRPTYLRSLFVSLVALIRLFSKSMNFIFYRGWIVIRQ